MDIITFTPGEVSRFYKDRIPHLKQTGAQWNCGCPRHGGKDPNFKVEAATGRWYCHSVCGCGGDIIDLEMALTGADFKAAKTEVFRLVGRNEPRHTTGGWREVERYPYTDADDNLLLEVVRFLKPDGKKTFVQVRPSGVEAAGTIDPERIGGVPTGGIVIGLSKGKYLPDPKAERATGKLREELLRASGVGHVGTECWHARKDGTRFWANVVTMALKDTNGDLQGFASVVRDFSDRHEKAEALRRGSKEIGIPEGSAVIGIVSGEFDRITEANEAFLAMAGFSHEDLWQGLLHWPDFTPTEYLGLDEAAHEEALRFGSSTPLERDLLCKDGNRIHVRIAIAILRLSPFRWIAFVRDLRDLDHLENVDQEAVDFNHNFGEIVGSSTAMRRVMKQVEMVAPTDATVLIMGETGTGKELIARATHNISPRRNLPFVTLNCAAIPTGLLESELFGYERGAFTGALSQKIGRFEMANRGTLFLDEVGDIPLELQPKLLRALQEKSFERLGGTKTIAIDVRLVAATNRNLSQMMAEKLFRSDLYYRLKVFPITTPPLRDRPEDIPVLARYFTKKYAAKMNREITKISTETMRVLVSWPWPGNVRELENFIERSVIVSSGSTLRAPLGELVVTAETTGGSGITLEEMEREHILKVLRNTNGVVTAAATQLGLHRTTLTALMRRLGISRGKF
ncbi:MAG: sigma 54-interacting transcriptional regulator [Candidatus Solibacter sp.]|nr:sigma 54-interacting transcriptional regulator [Candidatus Solibacter sp.]